MASAPRRSQVALTSSVTLARARELFLNSQCRRDAARPARAAWAVQRLLAAAATLSGTGSASPRPDRTSWLGVAAALTPLIALTRARARQWSARCYGVARQRDGARQNSIGVSGVLSLRHFGLVLFIHWRVGAEESGAAKYGFGRRDA